MPPSSALALLTDLYQLTMAYGYWKSGLHRKEAVFHLFFRQNPFAGGFSIACGIKPALEFIRNLAYAPDDLHYLATLQGDDEKPLFGSDFIEFLQGCRFTGDIDAVPEGTVVFPFEPLVRVQGPILECQLLETALLNIINFQTLIATKAARVCQAAGEQPVLEFGARRAQGFDGALSASRAAYIGGCAATSNVLAGKQYGIPVKGTHAHSWVMAFESELQAFEAWAKAMPNNSVLLVDTFDSVEGVRHAVQVGQRLRAAGHRLAGVRLDSGDLAYLSRQARTMLDEAGFQDASIFASNDLDEHIITSLKLQGAPIDVWGVGTRLVTGNEQSALGGVYKLSAIREPGGPWQFRVKVSEQAAKTSTPGVQQIRRYSEKGNYVADVVYDLGRDVSQGCEMIDPFDPTRRRRLAGSEFEDLLQPMLRQGVPVGELPSEGQARQAAKLGLSRVYSGTRRFVNPHVYPVGLETSLYDARIKLIVETRRARGAA